MYGSSSMYGSGGMYGSTYGGSMYGRPGMYGGGMYSSGERRSYTSTAGRQVQEQHGARRERVLWLHKHPPTLLPRQSWRLEHSKLTQALSVHAQ